MLAQDAPLDQEQSYALLSKTECLFAAIWHNPEGAVNTEAIAQYYEVSPEIILDTLVLYQDEFDLQGDDWTPRAAIRLGMLLKSPQATRVRSLALDVIEAQKCKTKRESITHLLKNSEFVQWSDREISKILQCSPTIVGKARKELESQGKIVKFEKRKFNRGGNTIEQSTKESVFQTSSVHKWTDEAQNPDSTVVRITNPDHPNFNQQGVITSEPPNRYQQIVEIGGERVLVQNSDFGMEYTPKPRTYTEEELQQAIARAIQEIQIGDRAKVREEVEAEVQEQLKSARELLNQKAVEAAKLQQKIDELESLRTLEAENVLLKQRIEELEKAVQDVPAQRWENTMSVQASKVINTQAQTIIENIDPYLDLRNLATTPPPRDRFNEVSDLIEKAADLLDRVPRIGRRCSYQGRLGTIEDIEGNEAEINWDERKAEDSAGDRYPLRGIEVLPTLDGIAKGSWVSWANPKEEAYNYQGQVVEVSPRTGIAVVHWRNTNKTKQHPVMALRLIRARVA